ncbi:DEAD/DEAH box helicase [Priestia endophytica]|jgi:competence protein ComFA|uniref:DEAD/DEAH box helicase n=1 Tax=Priestia endophytica TaxID=135735 RepID=UPI00124E453A|nr:DEAD/DEAH box helicase [Priestia endophytica]KAB2490570.1 DEAD/DEAH box helicase [Priestia endophytica]
MLFTVEDNKLVFSPQEGQPISYHSTYTFYPINDAYPFSQKLQEELSQRKLLLTELSVPFVTLYEHYKEGYVQIIKGINKKKDICQCNRCGNTVLQKFGAFPCYTCKEMCFYCRACIGMGRISMCTPLFVWSGPIYKKREHPAFLAWNGKLSEMQQKGAEAIKETIRGKGELLVWAACGAGKTEMLFEGINYALSQGENVLIATPRADVVRELKPRIAQAFPYSSVIALYGGSEDRGKSGAITISTTHQMLRYEKAFDVVIVDEVDAFPFSYDKMLQQAVENVKKQSCATILLTATPNRQWQREIRRGRRDAFVLPARYHRREIPVPHMIWCGNWKKQLLKNELPWKLKKWLKERREKQVFLFVPSIEVIPKIVGIMKKGEKQTEGVHAEDHDREKKVLRFRNGETRILVTTTILERGVTVPNIDVAVLGAEEDIFTESALVQIGGRVGRSANYPNGDVTLFHFGRTQEMIRARKQILSLNEKARKMGLIE